MERLQWDWGLVEGRARRSRKGEKEILKILLETICCSFNNIEGTQVKA